LDEAASRQLRPLDTAIRRRAAAFPREGRVVGWSIQSSLHTNIVLSALTMAVGQRLPGPGLLQHSDRGSQYTSDDYQRMLRSHGIACSFSGCGNCWDNACVESFFVTLKRELIHRRGWPTRREAADRAAPDRRPETAA
jgi:transposase InsO family protein